MAGTESGILLNTHRTHRTRAGRPSMIIEFRRGLTTRRVPRGGMRELPFSFFAKRVNFIWKEKLVKNGQMSFPNKQTDPDTPSVCCRFWKLKWKWREGRRYDYYVSGNDWCWILHGLARHILSLSFFSSIMYFMETWKFFLTISSYWEKIIVLASTTIL